VLAKGYVKVAGNPDGARILGAVMAMNARVPANNIASGASGNGKIQFSRCAINTLMARRATVAIAKYRAWADLSF
jgi:hypothetical protein